MHVPCAGGAAAPSQRRLLLVSQILALVVAALGLTVLLGWCFDWSAARSLWFGLPPMQLHTALGFVLAALSLLLRGLPYPAAPALARVLGGGVLLLGAATLGRDLLGGLPGLAHGFSDVGPGPGPTRMTPATALCLGLCGAALAAGPGRWGQRLAQGSAALAGLLALMPRLGYLLDAQTLDHLGPWSGMAVHTAPGMVLLATATLLARARGPLNSLCGLATGAALAALVAVGVVAVGHVSLPATEATHALRVLVTAAALATLTLLAVLAALWREAARRQRSEHALQAHQNRLEELVAQRTAALAHSEARQRLLLENAPVALAMFDTQMRYLAVSRRWVEDFEEHAHSAQDLIGRGFYELRPELPERWKAVHRRALAGEAVRMDAELVPWPDGTPRWLRWKVHPWRDDQGTVGGIAMFAEDITRRRATELALAERESQLALAVEAGNVGIWRWSPESGELVVSERCRALFGFAPQAPVGEADLAACVFPEDRERRRAAIRTALREGRPYRLEYRVRWPDGSMHWIATAGRLHGTGLPGGARQLIGVLYDATERRQQEQALRESQQRLQRWNTDLAGEVALRTAELQQHQRELEAAKEAAEQASQAKSAFLSTMSHEIRTPLNAILGTVQLLEHQGLDTDQRRLVRNLRQAGRTLLALVDDVLDLSRIESGHAEPVNAPFVLRELLESQLEVFSPTAVAKGLRLVLEPLPEGVEGLVGDARYIGQILSNLLGNALKFTAAGSVTLTVTAGARDAQGLRLRFGVRDTGIGIEPERVERIFEAFVQADASIHRRYGGTGLGLAICRRLVRLMGGEIGVHSRPGQGSELWFELPLGTAPTSPRAGAVAAPSPGKRLAGLRLLVVDDSPTNLEIAQRLLAHEGAVAATAEGGEAALALLRQQPGRFDLVLMDLQMPELDGFQLTSRLREDPALAALPVVALSADVLPRQRERARAVGMQDFLAKPLELDALVAVVLRCTGGAPGVAAPASVAASVPGAAAAQPPGADFPRVPGVDEAQAARRLLGDRALFLHLLRALCEEGAGALPAVREALALGEAAVAAARLHRLRGMAAQVAAGEVARGAAALEQALAQATVAADDARLAALETALHRVQAGLPAAESPLPAEAAATAADAPPPDAAAVARLMAALDAGDLSALRAFEALRASLAACHGPAAVQELAQWVQGLQFAAAAARLRAWASPG